MFKGIGRKCEDVKALFIQDLSMQKMGVFSLLDQYLKHVQSLSILIQHEVKINCQYSWKYTFSITNYNHSPESRCKSNFQNIYVHHSNFVYVTVMNSLRHTRHESAIGLSQEILISQ